MPGDYSIAEIGRKSAAPIDDIFKKKPIEDDNAGAKASFPISVMNPGLMAVNNSSCDGDSGGFQA